MERLSSETDIVEPKLKPAANHDRINNLCEIIAKKDYIILPSEMSQSLLSAEDEDVLDDRTEFQRRWNRREHAPFMKGGGTYRWSTTPQHSNGVLKQ
ncbi:hypothetical protein [Musicola keenii]|uniref:hypothetical protein n=1 Tax=Musicola keenii TaxID=2884250 RepID=UPI0022A9FAD6|nr:hypothetical protein [Musicola keenii]